MAAYPQIHVALRPSAIWMSPESVPENVIFWGDELFHGPVPADTSFVAVRRARQFYWESLSNRLSEPVAPDVLARFERIARTRSRPPDPEDIAARIRSGAEVNLWFGPGLGQQLAMLQCIALAQDSPSELYTMQSSMESTLRPQALEHRALIDRVRLSPAARKDATELWDLFVSSSPVAFVRRLAVADEQRFPHLRATRTQFCGLFPRTGNGLCQIRQTLLSRLDASPERAVDLVLALLTGNKHGDGFLWGLILDELINPVPLVECGEIPKPLNIKAILTKKVSLTESGRKVLHGESDAITLNGIDKWIGGCHLDSTSETVYRWDEGAGAFTTPSGRIEVI